MLQILEHVKNHTKPTTGQCNGLPTTDLSSCSSSNQCNIGEGDFDLDSYCAGSLSCVNDDCRTDLSSPGNNWASNADCCKDIFLSRNNSRL